MSFGLALGPTLALRVTLSSLYRVFHRVCSLARVFVLLLFSSLLSGCIPLFLTFLLRRPWRTFPGRPPAGVTRPHTPTRLAKPFLTISDVQPNWLFKEKNLYSVFCVLFSRAYFITLHSDAQAHASGLDVG